MTKIYDAQNYNIELSYYTVIPSIIFVNKNLTPSAKLLYGVISNLYGRNGFVLLDYKLWGSFLQLTPDAVYKTYKLLIKNNLVTEEKRNIKINNYTIEQKRIVLICEVS